MSIMRDCWVSGMTNAATHRDRVPQKHAAHVALWRHHNHLRTIHKDGMPF